MPDDIASAARRVADAVRDHSAERPAWSALWTLLPVLDAVARSGDDAGRVERIARSLCIASGHADPDESYADAPMWQRYEAHVRFVLRLADAERAAALTEGWPHYLLARDSLHEAAWDDGEARFEMSDATSDARAALDAAVRRLAGATGDRVP